ncbi:7057_t:CDS:2 [Cetraspora pellucida]|uniref:7057_t:CDS:1 n=1 Tax=Cetraspora pellucida TaxID=1433469 RepID=A0ACA9MCM7_9GLOM|nr:7057_t:CDS:2 [Cetraspora pellucida]
MSDAKNIQTKTLQTPGQANCIQGIINEIKNKELKEQLDKLKEEKKDLKKENSMLKQAIKKCNDFYIAIDKKANIILDNFIIQYEKTNDLETKIDKISVVKLETLRIKNETLKNENKDLQNIDEKCKKLAKENKKLLTENKELTKKNDKLVYLIYKITLFKFEQMNKGITESLENLDKKIDKCLNSLKINFISLDSNIYKIDKIILASENL